jgi:hypothetical protein
MTSECGQRHQNGRMDGVGLVENMLHIGWKEVGKLSFRA